MQTDHLKTSAVALDEWLVRAALILLGTLSLILLIGQYTDIDMMLAEVYFDPARKLFPWNDTWFARDLMHGYVKNVIVWCGHLIMITALIDLAVPLFGMSALQRLRLRIVALAAALEPALILTLKGRSAMHCPWGIDRFGGSHPYLRLLDVVPDGWQAGHCFPAGHASVAMWLPVLAVFWLPDNPRRATLVFLGGLGAGFFLGWVQQMRGQHFLTHTLWTMWLASALLVALLAVFSRQIGGADRVGGKRIAARIIVP